MVYRENMNALRIWRSSIYIQRKTAFGTYLQAFRLHLSLFHQVYRQYWNTSTGIPAFSNKYTYRLTHYWLKGDRLEFIVFITLKWSKFAGSSSGNNITLQINQGALV